MRLRGRLWLVVVVVCLALAPARSEAAAIGTTLLTDDALVTIPLTITAESLVTIQLSAEFWPALSLFGPPDDPLDPNQVLFQGLQWITQFQPLDGNEILFTRTFAPSTTDYLIVISQSPNLFDPISSAAFPGGWVADNDPEFLTRDFPDCPGFVDFEGACGNGEFTGTLTVEPIAAPEPGTLSLITLGAAALAARTRRRRRDES